MTFFTLGFQSSLCNSVLFIEVFISFSFLGYEFYADAGMGFDDFRW